MTLALLVAAALRADGWNAARAILVTPHATAAYARLVIPATIDGGPDGRYPDLRIAAGDDRETPYALDANPASAASSPVILSDVGFVRGRYTQAVADLGPSGMLHANIELATSQPTFFERVEIATSDDRRTWAVAQPAALIYRVAANDDAGQRSIAFDPSRARWIRIRILDGTHAFPIAGASVAARPVPPRLVPLEAATAAQTTGAHTVVTLTFVAPNTNLNAVAFESRTPEFSRNVTFESNDGRSSDGRLAWQYLDGAAIARFSAGRPTLTVDLGNRYARMLRITIDNGNDAPLSGLRVTPLGYEHHAIFRARPGVKYRLLWSNPAAIAPKYDLAERLAHEPWRVGAEAVLGAAASTALAPAESLPAIPWLQQAALPIALALVCVVLGAIALLALRRPRSAA